MSNETIKVVIADRVEEWGRKLLNWQNEHHILTLSCHRPYIRSAKII